MTLGEVRVPGSADVPNLPLLNPAIADGGDYSGPWGNDPDERLPKGFGIRFKTGGPAIGNNSPLSSSIPVFDLSAESAPDDHDNIVYGDELPVASLEPKLQHVLVPGKRLSWFEKYISYPINEYIVSPVVNFLSGSNAAVSGAPYYAPITVRPESLAAKLNYASVPDISRMNTLQQYRAASEFANQPKGTIFTADQVQNVLAQIQLAKANPSLPFQEKLHLLSAYGDVYARGNVEKVLHAKMTRGFAEYGMTVALMSGGTSIKTPIPSVPSQSSVLPRAKVFTPYPYISSLEPAEQLFAREMILGGKVVTAIPSTNKGRSADFWIDSSKYELKTVSNILKADSDGISKSLSSTIMNARGQSGDIVIDARKQSGMTSDIAIRGAGRAFGADRRDGSKINSITIITPQGTYFESRKP